LGIYPGAGLIGPMVTLIFFRNCQAIFN
jgi:hypothetical protein